MNRITDEQDKKCVLFAGYMELLKQPDKIASHSQLYAVHAPRQDQTFEQYRASTLQYLYSFLGLY